MIIDANATSIRGKVLFYVKINVQLYNYIIHESSKRFCGILAIICDIYMA